MTNYKNWTSHGRSFSMSAKEINIFQELYYQVRSDNDASEVDILGHFGKFWDILGHFGTLWDNLEDFTTSI